MDLQQRKLNRSEWDSIEVPISQDEKEVLKLIIDGYKNVNIKYNKINSLFSFLKIEYNDVMEDYLYNKYFEKKVKKIIEKYELNFIKINVNSNPQIKKADLIRLQKNTEELIEKELIYESILLDVIKSLVKYKQKDETKWEYYYFSLFKLLKNSVSHINRHITNICKKLLEHYEDEIEVSNIINKGVDYIEKNEYLLKYSDMCLYEHQKEIFTICKNPKPKLILYIAPTGTGKTLTPIGLSESHKIIFVCAARHVGLALSRAAISMNKKIAFAFGCGSAADIRLHYFAAKEVTKNWKTGGIWKVDNSVGDKVEIMICDVKSYLPAMYYMLSFNSAESIITYWDEPTITLDYDEHSFHEMIHKNWSENIIPNIVLSSATLPKIHELPDTTNDFITKFEGSTVYNIVSHECRKSIPILNKSGYVILPHYISDSYDKILEIVKHCENYLTLLRYFDLKEVIVFINYIVNEHELIPKNLNLKRYFSSLDDIDMKNIKLYYLKILKSINKENWAFIHNEFINKRKKRIVPNKYIDSKGNKTDPKNVDDNNCALYVTTKDSYTLTDGPTIFLASDVEKIAKFCVQQANIPAIVMNDIIDKINFNNTLNCKIEKIEKDIDDINEKKGLNDKCDDDGKKKKNDHKLNRQNDTPQDAELKKMGHEIEMLRAMIKIAKLNETFVPNSSLHLKKWAEHMPHNNPFTSNIDDNVINDIMLLKDVEDSWKVLLLMGIGVFTNHESIAYTEIMKKLADEQKLYLIIASSDYIYGTNYQFCHGYLSKDMNLTQEKIIQAMGRIGRNKIQQEYSIRFRDDDQIIKLFNTEVDKPEIKNMNKLFISEEKN